MIVIKLYTFGPLDDLPDVSAFVMKVMVLLKLAGLDFVEDRTGFHRAPKGKLPYIEDNGQVIADSAFIRSHLETAHGANFDGHLTAEQRAQGWAIEKMCEDHLYWLVVHSRWLVDANFNAGLARLFKAAPALLRPFIVKSVRAKVARALFAQGLGRHSDEERLALGRKDVDALSTLLGDKPYIFGDAPCGADAVVFAAVAALLSPCSASPLRDEALARPNLVDYRDRLMQQFFPEFRER